MLLTDLLSNFNWNFNLISGHVNSWWSWTASAFDLLSGIIRGAEFYRRYTASGKLLLMVKGGCEQTSITITCVCVIRIAHA